MRFAVVFLFAGCNAIFGLDDTHLLPPIDGRPDAPGCSGGSFTGAPILLPAFQANNVHEFEPQLRSDLKELWFSATTNQADRVYRSIWNEATQTFDPAQVAPFSSGDPSVDDSDPTISGDGLILMFTSNRGGGLRREVWEVRRTTIDAEFGAPHTVGGYGDHSVVSIDLSSDGLRAYFFDPNDTYVAERPSLDEPFGEATLAVVGAAYATISPDERELFFNPGPTSQLLHLVRPIRTDPFPPIANAMQVTDNGEDPDVAGDGKTLVVARNNSLVMFQRECPPGS